MSKQNEWTKELGQRISTARRSRRLSQDALAERAGISTIHLRGIETGRHCPSFVKMAKIARVLGMSLDEFGHGIKSGEELLLEEFEVVKQDPDFRSKFPLMAYGDIDLAAIRLLLETYKHIKRSQGIHESAAD